MLRRLRFTIIRRPLTWAPRSLFILGWLIAPAVINAQTSIQVGTNSTKFVLKGAIVRPDGLLQGKAVIEGDVLTCVAVACADPPGATQITVTNSYIFPGFIDAHPHHSDSGPWTDTN